MKLYALKCLETDLPQLIHNAELLGVVEDRDGEIVEKNGGCWDYIGYKYIGDAPAEGEPDTRTLLTDGNGVPYVHINCATPLDIAAIAAGLAVQYPEIAEGLSQLGRFFITDENGETSWPVSPMRVFL